jgi:hypothetical protein
MIWRRKRPPCLRLNTDTAVSNVTRIKPPNVSFSFGYQGPEVENSSKNRYFDNGKQDLMKENEKLRIVLRATVHENMKMKSDDQTLRKEKERVNSMITKLTAD